MKNNEELRSKVKTLDARLAELTKDRAIFEVSLNELVEVKDGELDELALGTIDEKDVKQTDKAIAEVKKQIEQQDELITRIQSKLYELTPQILPLLKADYDEKVAKQQAGANKKFNELKELRKSYLTAVKEYSALIRYGYHLEREYNDLREHYDPTFKRSKYQSNNVEAFRQFPSSYTGTPYESTFGITESNQSKAFGNPN